MVYPDDIVAVQHNRDSGAFLHCLNGDAATNSPWRQSYLLLRREEWGGWWERGLTSLPRGSKWMDEVVCDLRILYEDKLHRVTEQEEFSDPLTETTTASYIRPQTPGPIHFTVNIIYPQPDENNRIHLTINIPTMIVVKALVGEKATSSWSAPVLQTEVPFHPSCPEPVVQSIPDCKTKYAGSRFSSVMFVLPSLGVHTLNISVGHSDRVQTVEVHGYEAVMGLTKEPHACQRTLMFMPRTFTAKVESGSQVKFTWMIDNLGEFAHEGESCRVTFEKAAEYKLQVTASNPVSSQSLQILLTAEETTPLTEPQFLSVREVMAINVTHTYTFRVKVDIALPVAFKWDFGDGTAIKPSTLTVLYTWDFGDASKVIQGLHEKVNHSFESAGVYSVVVFASNSVSSLAASLMVIVMEKVSGLTVTFSSPSEAGAPVDFRAQVATGSDPIWGFDFGDESVLENLTDGYISHIYAFPGKYRVGVSASNAVSQARLSVLVEVYSLTVSGVLPTDCVMSGKDVQLTALVNGNVSSLSFHWTLGKDSLSVVMNGKPTVVHTFPAHGIFPIRLTVFSSFASVSLNSSICVESPIANVELQTSRGVVAVQEQVCLRALVSPEQTTVYQFMWFSSSSGLVSTTENSKCFAFSSEGDEEVFVVVSNKVSNKTAKTIISTQKPVSELTITHDSQSDALAVNKSTLFWVARVVGSNVSVVWDFGDGSPIEKKLNMSHVFYSTGTFTVTATAFNSISRDSAALNINVLLPVSDLSLHTDQLYAVVGQQIVITAVSSDRSITNYYWTVEGDPTEERTPQFQFISSKPGVFEVRVTAQNLVSKREEAVLIEVHEIIEGLQIECQSITDKKYIPTHEEILFTASVIKGSNITYHWLVAQRGVIQQQDGELFHVVADTPGRILVRLKASNILGQVISGVSLVAVERVTGAHLATQSSIVATGTAVNMTVFVNTGSHLQYRWYVNTNTSSHLTHEPFFLYTFTDLGLSFITVSVQNVLSQSRHTKQFTVQEEIRNVDFTIDGKKRPFSVNVSTFLSFHGFAHEGSGLHWTWKVKSGKENIFTSTDPTFTFRLVHIGMYLVSLNVSNDLNWQMTSHSITAQEPIKGFLLNISKTSLCTHEQVVFVPTVTKGSNVSFFIALQNKDKIQTQEIFGEQFATSNLSSGRHLVTVKALNLVSSAELSSSIVVTESIQGLHLINCCLISLEAKKGARFKAEVQTGSPINYTWTFQLENSEPMLLFGQEVNFTALESGLFSVTVHASDGACSQTIHETVRAEWPIRKVKLVCHSERIFVGQAVSLFATVIEGSSVRYLWDFGDSTTVLMTTVSAVGHVYNSTGKYTIAVKVFNSVSHVSTHLEVEVEALRCSSPQASLVQNQPTIFRSRLNFFEASVTMNCSAYKTSYLWEIFRGICLTNGTKVCLSDKDAALPLLILPKHSLHVGEYCLQLTVSFKGTPLAVQQETNITVVHSQLVAVIQGGSSRLWPYVRDLVLDGSGSHDPDVEPGVTDTLQYHWTCLMKNSTESPPVKLPIESTDTTMTVLSTQLHPGTLYIFILTVHKNGTRSTSVNQTVTVAEASVLPVTVTCVSCSASSSVHHVGPTTPAVLKGVCGQCDHQTLYKWRAEDQNGMTLDLSDIATSTGTHSPSLVVVPAEMVSEGCQETVLAAVETMIRVVEHQICPVGLTAVDLGRNLLDILGNTLAAVSESSRASSSHQTHSGSLKAASVVTSALTHAGALMRALMHSRVLNEEPLSFSNGYIRTAGFFGDPFGLLCLHQSNQFTENLMKSHSSSTEGFKRCPFLIPASLSAHLKTQSSEVVQVLLGMDAKLESDPFLDAANPPISTTLVAMELNSPQGRPLPIQDLTPEQAIQITLPNKYLETQDERGRNGKVQEAGNRTCPTATLANAGQVNFTVKVPDNLDENAGLYISFNFSLAPGGTPVRMGHIRVEVMMAVPGTNASQDSLVRQWALTLSAVTASSEETIFLSPLLNGTDKPISVSLAPSLNGTGPVQAAACVFSSLCRYYNVTEGRWSSEGLQPLEGSTLHAARCLTQHLTMFGASVFVHPGSVILLPPADGPMQNTVVGIVCAVLVMLHLLAGLIALKMDHLDRLRLSQVPLCGRSGLYQYRVLVKTGLRPGAGTTAHVGISLFGVSKSGSHHLQKEGSFQRGGLDQFQVETYDNLGEIWKIRIWHDNTGLDPSWYIKHVVVWDPLSDHMYFFLLEDWLSVENQKNQTVEREVLASCPAELTQFPRVLTSQLIFGMAEHHLWLSLWERPNHSSFTRAQRVTCSALVLHLYLALGTLWFGAVGIAGHSGPVSAHLLVNRETVAMGMSIALLVFPLQCFLCFLFRNVYSQVTLDSSAPPSLVCQSVEMDIWDSQSHISSTSFVSPQDSDCLSRSPSSLLESKALDSSIMNFWTSSGLVPLKERPDRLGALTWQSHDSLLCSLAGTCPTKEAMCRTSPATRQLKRKKAIIQLHLALPPHNDDALQRVCSPCSQSLTEDSYHLHKALVQSSPKSLHFNSSPAQVYRSKHLTLSEEDLLMSVAAEGTSEVINSNSDSGRDSPRTTSSFSASQGDWSDERSSSSSLYGGEAEQSDSELDSSSYGTGFYKCSSLHSMESLASTFLPQPLQESIHPSSTTRIGVARGRPRWLLPSWVLHVVHPLMALLVVACLAVVGLYGSLFSRAVVIMLLVSVLAAFLTSALLLEPLKVCVQALTCTLLWRSVDPEVEELLAQEAMVVRASAECGGNVRPPCGYGLQQAKQEARKIRALHSLMRHCVCQLGFLLLVLMVNYQDRIEQRQASLLHSAIRQHLHSTHPGSPNLTSLRDWSDAEWWIGHTLIQHLHQNPTLDLVGLPQVRFTHTLGASAVDLLGNNSSTTQQLLTDLHMSRRRFKSLSLDFTHHHRASALFLCVSIRLELTQTQGVSSFLTIHSLHLPSSVSGPSLHVVLTICFCTSALLIVFGELWSMLTERARYFYQCRHWFQLLLAFVSLMTAFLQLWFLSLASLCVSEMQSMQESFIDFHSAALLAYRSSQCAAVLLTLLALKLLGTLRFVRRWVMMGRVLQRASRELWAAAVLVVLLLLICSHLGNMLFHQSVEGFLSVEQTWVSVTSMLRSRRVLGQLCRVHPVLGPLYGLLVYGGSIWLLARLCGAVLIHVYREKQMELLHSTIEPQDYEMVEFFIKRLKLWMGLTKAKQFRHSVKFEDMDTPPSRSSQGSAFSTLSSSIPSSCSPSLSSSFPSLHPPSSVLSVTSEDFLVSKPNQEVQPCLDGLEPIVSMLLSSFDRVSQLTEDIYNLEVMLHEAQERQRKRRTSNRMENERIDVESAKPKEPKEENVPAEVRHRKIGLLYPKQHDSALWPISALDSVQSSCASRVSDATAVATEA
uniref:Polycystic kidney disease 1b n=1 Tax=Nothobranchius furzeri TaxID=105023 RepID=A0A1A8UGE7_NOTFU